MPESIDIEQLEDGPGKLDYPRANGAPLVSDPENPGKRLRYSRPSGFGKPLDDEEALTHWRIWKAMQGVAKSPALGAQIMATKEEDRDAKKVLREQALDKGTANESADLGTALHAMTARIEDVNDLWEPPEIYAADLAAYMATLETYGLVSEMVEVAMVADDFRAAGTTDRIYRLTKVLTTPDGSTLQPGELVLADIKTGKKLDFSAPGYCIQTALYVDGCLYDLATERRMPTPPINRNWTILVHLPVGKATCHLHWCSVEVGLQGAMYASFVKDWQRKWRNGTYDVPRIEAPIDVVAVLEEELGAEVVIDEGMVDALVSFVSLRVRSIGQHPEARDRLTREWPIGVPTPRQGLCKPGDIDRVLSVLDEVEKQYSLPFVMHDPRSVIQAGRHRTDVVRA